MLHRGLFTLTILLALGRVGTAQMAVAVVGGSVQDQTGAVLPGATVELVTSSGSVAQATAADAAGAFRFDNVAAGQYDLRARYDGFKPANARVRVGSRSPGAQKLVLGLADLTQEITVSNASGTVTTETSENRDAIVIDDKALDDLPIFDRDVVGAVSRFLDAGAIGTGGATLVVDGMEARNIGVSTSAIQQVRINQDPYAAEFARPGRGRIEIVTKAGTAAYRGSADFMFRDARLNARDPFAATRAPGQRRIADVFLSGPIRGGRTTSFMLTAERNEEDLQAVVYAVDPSGTIRANVVRPRRGLQLSGTINHQRGKDTTLSLRVTHENRSRRNQGVGGTSLLEAASDERSHEEQTVYSQRNIVTKRLLHELRFLYGQDEENTVSVNGGPRIVVLDAFTGGGAQSDRLQTEHHANVTDTLTYATGKHVVKAGVNIPDWSRRRNDDLTNTDGTFTFSTLQDFTLGRPFSFLQQRGDGRLVFLQKVLGGFVQDQIALRSNLTVSAGLRYDWQNYFVDNNNFSPRASFAYAPGERHGTVVRGGAGIFYDRAGQGPISDVLYSRQGRLFRYLVLDPTYPDASQGGTAQATPPSIVRPGSGLTIPYTVQYSLGVERQVRKSATLAVNYVGTRGINMFRSRDVNAPPPPLYLARPDPAYGVLREIESTGRQQADSIQFTLRGRIGRVFNGSAQYALGRARNDTNGINSLPADNYDLSGEWGRAEFDQRHRFDIFDRFSVGKLFDLGISLSLSSGRPYSLRTGRDDFNNGQANARPAGVARNTLQGPGYAVLDLRWSRQIVARTRTSEDDSRSIAIGVDAFNVLNRVNYSNYVGNISSPFFGRATSAQPPRRLQMSLRARF